MAETPSKHAHPPAGELPAWQRLAKLAAKTSHRDLAKLLEDSERGGALRLSVGGILFDFSKQKVTLQILNITVVPLREAVAGKLREETKQFWFLS